MDGHNWYINMAAAAAALTLFHARGTQQNNT